eukprot:217242-Chlamydomonas_euryale.AAC.2
MADMLAGAVMGGKGSFQTRHIALVQAWPYDHLVMRGASGIEALRKVVPQTSASSDVYMEAVEGLLRCFAQALLPVAQLCVAQHRLVV